MIAQRTRTSSSTALNFLLADHLGSTTAVIGSGGTYTVKYWPFGTMRSGALASDRGFTGQYKEGPLTTTMDAYFYRARFYSPKTAHFMSADTLVPEASARGLNRFSYVGNNPGSYVDPTGHCLIFFGADLECSPEIAATILACSVSVTSCSAAMGLSGVRHDPNLIAQGHQFADAAVNGPYRHLYWASFFDPSIYPFAEPNTSTIGPFPDPNGAERLLALGRQRYTLEDAVAVKRFARSLTAWCEVTCAYLSGQSVQLGGILAGYYTGNAGYMMFSMGLYTDNVQAAWLRYRAEREREGEASLTPVWYASLGGVLSVVGPDDVRSQAAIDLTVDVLELYEERNCLRGRERC